MFRATTFLGGNMRLLFLFVLSFLAPFSALAKEPVVSMPCRHVHVCAKPACFQALAGCAEMATTTLSLSEQQAIRAIREYLGQYQSSERLNGLVHMIQDQEPKYQIRDPSQRRLWLAIARTAAGFREYGDCMSRGFWVMATWLPYSNTTYEFEVGQSYLAYRWSELYRCERLDK